MRRIARVLVWLIAIVVLIAIVLAFTYRQLTLPKVDGSLTIAGLSAPVDVVRDAEGIPHIYAASDDDAWFALGFVHAQDRLWQMEMNRRTAAGRLAEVLGPGALDTDRLLRTLGVYRNAQAMETRLNDNTRRALARYAAGVNANLEQRKHSPRSALPSEFLLTGAPFPEPWTPPDSVAWSTMMAWDQSTNWSSELMRMRLSQRLTKQQIDELLPPYPGNPRVAPDGTRTDAVPDAPPQVADYTALYRSLKEEGAALSEAAASLIALAPPGHIEGKGSNNWVVSGARAMSGKPLLANDPHLDLSAPSIWYLAHLSAPDLNVIGATLPGIPFVVIGRNDRIGWGLTNTGPDTQDLYLEELRDNGGQPEARTPDGWQPLVTRSEVIGVKGGADVLLNVRASRHGPLISDVSRAATDATRQIGNRKYAIAFQWAALRDDDKTMQAGLAIDRATDWTSFVAAVRDFHSPQQNIVYADVDGNIGFIAPGRVPIRRPDNDLKGRAPVPGWDARYDWEGFVALEDLPQRLNPPQGRIVTANHKIVQDDYVPYLTSEWAAPFRARRIEELLDATPRHDVASFAKIQGDVRSLPAVRLLPILLKTPPSNDAAKDVIARLSTWDGTMSASRPEPLIFAAWMRELTRLVTRDELGSELFADYWEQRTVFMINVLSNRDGQSRWCDDVTTPAVETCAQMQTRALDLALADLTRRIGPNRNEWRWDLLHVARSEHRPFARVPPLDRIFDLRVPVGGDTHTVNLADYAIRNEGEPFIDRHGPSLRQIIDFGDLEQSRFVQSTGQSGNRLSPFYASFVKRWAAVESVPMRMHRAEVEKDARATLHMTP
ncbi:MAG: penicillin acylase family protein [Burkholderiaceae bacterium]